MKKSSTYTFYLFMMLFSFISKVSAQFNPFLSKPDKNIHMVVALNQQQGSDIDTAYIYEYNRKGLLVQERIPAYYVFVSYTYDDSDRLIEREALYGESFGNGTTKYEYRKDTLIETMHLMVSYYQSIKYLDKSGKLLKESNRMVSANSNESFTEEVIYSYLSDGQVSMRQSNRQYYDFEMDMDKFMELSGDDLNKLFLESKPIRTEKKHKVFDYKNGKIRKEITYNSDNQRKMNEIIYEYLANGKILKHEEVNFVYPESEIKKPVPVKQVVAKKIHHYDKNNEVSDIIEESDGYRSKGIYKAGKLIRVVELAGDKENAQSAVDYKYFYFSD